MKILADANIEQAIVSRLRTQKYDVVWAAELAPATPDEDLLRYSNESGRVLLTYDKDLGELVFRRHSLSHGVILLRFGAGTQSERLALLQRHWPSIASSTHSSFTVITDDQVRVRPIAQPDL